MIRTRIFHTLCLSPNVEPRPAGVLPSILLLHYTGMKSAEVARNWLCSPRSRVSCHYLVDEYGEVTQMVGEEMRAQHAGISYWSGETDINSHSIGIEIHNPGHTMGYPAFPDVQMKSLAALARDIVERNEIWPERILGHSDVAPRRKIDPGEKFDWAQLHRAGVGHWVEPAPLPLVDASIALDSGAIIDLQEKLKVYGYDITPTGAFDKQTEIVVKAFQRHFRPEKIDGQVDRSTIDTLDRLIQAIGQP